ALINSIALVARRDALLLFGITDGAQLGALALRPFAQPSSSMPIAAPSRCKPLHPAHRLGRLAPEPLSLPRLSPNIKNAPLPGFLNIVLSTTLWVVSILKG